MTWALVGVSAGIASAAGSASASAGATKQAREASEAAAKEQKRQFDIRNQAYNQMIGSAKTMGTEGEQQFLGETANPLAELGAAKEGALTGNAAALQQGAGQMKANLAQSGVRGGQAATLLNRGTGQQSVDANQQINQMAMDEASQRRQMRAGLMGQKAGAGWSGQLQQFGG